MGYDVFISYSTQDKMTADAVCAILESQGIRCWIAPRDISLVDAIEMCPVLVLVFSKHANESHQIKREVNLAIDNGRTVIPVRVEDVMPSKSLKFSININHWLDAFPPPLENHLQVLASSIRAHLKATAAKGEVVGAMLAPESSPEVLVATPLTEPLVAEAAPEPKAEVPALPRSVAVAPVSSAPAVSVPAEPPALPQPKKAPPPFVPPAALRSPPEVGARPARKFPVKALVIGLVWVAVFLCATIMADIMATMMVQGKTGGKLTDDQTDSVGGWALLSMFAAIGAAVGLSWMGWLPGTRRR
jgi:hypothetical protein